MKILGLLILFLSVGIATASYEEDVVRVNIACQLIKHKLDCQVPAKPLHGDLEVLHEWLPNGDCKISCGTSSLTVTPQNGVARVLIDGKLYEFKSRVSAPADDCPS